MKFEMNLEISIVIKTFKFGIFIELS